MCVSLIVALRNSAVPRPSDLRSRCPSTSLCVAALCRKPGSIVPERGFRCRECIHTSFNPWPAARAPKSIGLPE